MRTEQYFGMEQLARIKSLVNPLETIAACVECALNVFISRYAGKHSVLLVLGRDVSRMYLLQCPRRLHPKQLKRRLITVDESTLVEHQHGVARAVEER